MGRIYSRKSVKDIETAADTIIPESLGSSTLNKLAGGAAKLTVSVDLHADKPLDDIADKRSHRTLL